MGVTIHHKLKQNKIYVKDTLDRAQALAETIKKEQADKMGLSVEVRRLNDMALLIDFYGCETLALEFESKADVQADKYTSWKRDELDNGYNVDEYPQNELYFSSGSCKTQYAKSILAHVWVAELIRIVASYCPYAHVCDEGNYYHSGSIEDASESIESLGKMIANLGATLNKLYGADNVVAGGNTTIKSHKR